MAVYLGLVLALTDGLESWAIPAFEPFDAERFLGRSAEWVDWEYEIDSQASTIDERDVGFVPGRSCVPYPPADTAYEREHAAQAGVFNVSGHADLVELVIAVIRDACGELSLFGLRPGSAPALLAGLRGSTEPRLDELLAPGAMLVDLTLGVDYDYYDSLIIWSREDLADRLDALAQRFNEAVAAYEARVPSVTTVDQLLAELDRLVAGRS